MNTLDRADCSSNKTEAMTAGENAAEMFALSELPTGISDLTLGSAGCDAMHLFELIHAAVDKLIPLQVTTPEVRADLQSATAMLWIARDLAETLEWKLQRMDRIQGSI